MPKGIHELPRLKELCLSHNRIGKLAESFGLGAVCNNNNNNNNTI